MPSSQPSSSPQTTPSQSQPQSQHQQVTEQQLKSRAENGVNVEDYLLPRSLTARLAKSVLPPNTTIQKDALLAMQKAATVFVSYLSSHANEATLKRTVAPTDVFSAIEELEFGRFRERLEKELDVYTEVKAGKRKKAAATPGDGAAGGEQKGGEKADEEETAVRGAKRVKRAGEEGQAKGDDVEGEGEGDDDEAEAAEEEEDIDEDEAEEDEDEEEEEGEGEEAQEDDINLVEDLDRDSRAKRTMDPDAAADSDSDDEGPGSQLRGDMGMD